MSEETLLSAARRVVRFFNIDQQHGGLVSIDTLKAVETLDVQVSREVDRQNRVLPPDDLPPSPVDPSLDPVPPSLAAAVAA